MENDAPAVDTSPPSGLVEDCAMWLDLPGNLLKMNASAQSLAWATLFSLSRLIQNGCRCSFGLILSFWKYAEQGR